MYEYFLELHNEVPSLVWEVVDLRVAKKKEKKWVIC